MLDEMGWVGAPTNEREREMGKEKRGEKRGDRRMVPRATWTPHINT